MSKENESKKSLSPTKSDMQVTEYKEIYMITQWIFYKEKLRRDCYSAENKEKREAFF